MKLFRLIFLVLTIITGISGVALCQEKSNITFCKDIGDKWDPIEPASEFSTNSVSWVCKTEKPYGTPKILFSVYLDREAGGQALLARTTVDVNPSWNTTAIRNMIFPGPGVYTLSFSTLGGDHIASGTVKITDKKVPEKPLEEQKTVEGTTLEAIFNKYKPI